MFQRRFSIIDWIALQSKLEKYFWLHSNISKFPFLGARSCHLINLHCFFFLNFIINFWPINSVGTNRLRGALNVCKWHLIITCMHAMSQMMVLMLFILLLNLKIASYFFWIQSIRTTGFYLYFDTYNCSMQYGTEEKHR